MPDRAISVNVVTVVTTAKSLIVYINHEAMFVSFPNCVSKG
jgi:hypothetical protein